MPTQRPVLRLSAQVAKIDTIPEHPELDLSPQEKRLFRQLFSAADAENVGVVTGEVAVKFFEKTKLPPAVLGEVKTFSRSADSPMIVADDSGIPDMADR